MNRVVVLLLIGVVLISFSHSDTIELSIHLHKGWNLISFPVYNISYENNIHLYEKIGERYVQVEEPIPGKGYWVFSQEDRELKVSGTPIYSITLHLDKGNPMYVGGPACEIRPPFKIYAYNSSSKSFVPVAEMLPGYGYYINPMREHTIILECPEHASNILISCDYDGVCEPEHGENISTCADCWLTRLCRFSSLRYSYYDLWDFINDILIGLFGTCGDRRCSPLESEDTCPVDCAPGYGWIQYKGNHLRDSTTMNYGPVSGEILWETNLSSRFASSPIVDEDEMFVLINEYYDDGSVYISAYKTDTGERKWTTYIGSWSERRISIPAVYKGRVYTLSNDGFYIINLTTGDVMFTDHVSPSSFPPILILPGNESSSPNYLYGAPLVVYVSSNNTVVARSIPNNVIVWQTQLRNTHPYVLSESEYASRVGLLAGDDSIVYVVAYHNVSTESFKRWVYAIDRGNGRIIWSSPIPLRHFTAYPINDITVGDEWVMTVSYQEGAAVKFNKTDGSYVWSNVILGDPPYMFIPYISPSGPWALLDEDTYASKTDGKLGIYRDETSSSGDVYGDHIGTFQPADEPDDLEEYYPFCLAVSKLSRQIIVPFLSTYETLDEDGEYVPHPYFNSIYSISLDEALSGGSITDWNWKTRSFLFSRGPIGCPAMDSKHVYMVTKHPTYDFPARLICIQ